MATSAERVKEIRRKKREQGICGELGCENLSGSDFRCEPCNEKHNDLDREVRRKRRGEAA